MSIEIIGMVGTKDVSESRGSFDGPPIDTGYLTRFAQAHEAAGFDRVLIGYGATSPDGFAVAAVGSERLQRQAADRDVHDERLWYGVTKLTGPGGNSTALVGTPRQVADALTAYRRVGVDTVLIRGFDPLDDVVDWGTELVPLLREQAASTPAGTEADAVRA